MGALSPAHIRGQANRLHFRPILKGPHSPLPGRVFPGNRITSRCATLLFLGVCVCCCSFPSERQRLVGLDHSPTPFAHDQARRRAGARYLFSAGVRYRKGVPLGFGKQSCCFLETQRSCMSGKQSANGEEAQRGSRVAETSLVVHLREGLPLCRSRETVLPSQTGCLLPKGKGHGRVLVAQCPAPEAASLKLSGYLTDTTSGGRVVAATF